ncbi:MAG: MBL fold metallo-hydrolase [Candidatus Woesearchaeota archaeon]
MSLKVMPYGGVGDTLFGELGGVQLLFIDEGKDTKFMLDIGQRPDHTNDYYGFPFKAPRHRTLAISEFLGSYPPIENLYRHDYMERMGKKAGPVPLDGILITHEHFDHMGGLPLIRHDQPVYVNEKSLLQMYIWQYVGGGINEFVDLYERSMIGMSVSGEEKILKGMESFIPRNIQRFRPEEPFKIGNLDVTAYRIDHSVPGACGFIIDTSVGKIGISGDIRYRGRRPETTERFVDKCVEEKVKYMFLEGSLLHFPHSGTEADITQAVADVTKYATLATISYPIRDFDRLTSLYHAAKQNKRMLTISMDQALYLKAYDGSDGFPRLDWKYIGVYIPPMGNGFFDDPRYPQELAFEDYKMWQRPFLDKNEWIRHENKIQRVTINDIKNNQDQFLMTLGGNSSLMLSTYEYIRPRHGSKHIRSNPQGWTKGMEVEDEKKINVLKDFTMYDGPQPDYFEQSQMRDHTQIHITGHMNTQEVQRTINKFDPDVTTFYPYHTLQLGLFTNLFKYGNYLTPIRGQMMELK